MKSNLLSSRLRMSGVILLGVAALLLLPMSNAVAGVPRSIWDVHPRDGGQGGRVLYDAATWLFSNTYLRLYTSYATEPPDEGLPWHAAGGPLLLSAEGDPTTSTDNNHFLYGFTPQDEGDVTTPGGFADYTYTIAWDVSADGTGGQQVLWGAGGADGGTVTTFIFDDTTLTSYLDWTDATGMVRGVQKMTLLRDMVRVSFDLYNEDQVPHTIGFRMQFNPRPNSVDDITDSGPEIPLHISGMLGLQYPTVLKGVDVPDQWYYTIPSGGGAARFGGRLYNFLDATRPDQFQFANLWEVVDPAVDGSGGMIWDYTPVFAAIPVQDAAVCYRWNSLTVLPGQKRTVTTYIGYLGPTVDYNSPMALAVYSPREIRVIRGDNPDTPAIVEDYYFSPDPFEISAYLMNLSTEPRTGATAMLILPAGLALDTGETATKTIGNLGVGAEGKASWKVRPATTASGTLSFAAQTDAVPSAPKLVQRTINISSMPTRAVKAGVQMITAPYSFADSDPKVALGLPPGTILEDLVRWDPNREVFGSGVRGAYARYPDPFVTTLKRGFAYWLRVATTGSLVYNNADIPAQTDFSVPLEVGWNQVADPYLVPYQLGRLLVNYQGQVVDFTQGARQGWLRATLYYWDPTKGTSGEYVTSGSNTYLLQPFTGYWIRALVKCDLVFHANEIALGTRAAVLAQPELGVSLAAVPEGWGFELTAMDNSGNSARVALGASALAQDTYDAYDIDSPPPFANPVTLAIPHADWGKDSGAYMRDVHAYKTAGSTEWVIQANGAPGSSMLLTWPNLQAVPRDLTLTLTDLATGQQLFMRTAPGYRFDVGSEGRRAFKVTATAGGQGSLRLSGLQLEPYGRGAKAITFMVSSPATVNVTITTLTGMTVRRLAVDAAASAGKASFVWDGTSDTGNYLAPGFYLCQVEARTQDGQRATAVRTISQQ